HVARHGVAVAGVSLEQRLQLRMMGAMWLVRWAHVDDLAVDHLVPRLRHDEAFIDGVGTIRVLVGHIGRIARDATRPPPWCSVMCLAAARNKLPRTMEEEGLAPGTVLDGKFRIVRRLGTGGM